MWEFPRICGVPKNWGIPRFPRIWEFPRIFGVSRDWGLLRIREIPRIS